MLREQGTLWKPTHAELASAAAQMQEIAAQVQNWSTAVPCIVCNAMQCNAI